jgi:hypothetical protein
MRPFVIAGTGRSGTMGMAMLLNRAGIRTAFEQFFCAREVNALVGSRYPCFLAETGCAGEVSSLAPPYLRHLPTETVILHQVRNPVATLASLMGQWDITGDSIKWWPNIKFNRMYVPETSADDEPLAFYIRYWLRWNEMIEPYAARRYRIEDLAPALWATLLADIGAELTEQTKAAFAAYATDYNAGKRHLRVTWRAIPKGELKQRLLKKATEYGYTEDELDAYCPCPDTCPHCHKQFARLASPPPAAKE